MRNSYLSDGHVMSASSELPVAGISSVLQLSSLLFDASITKRIMVHCPSFPAKVSKTPIRVNPLAYSLCGEKSSSTADELDSFADATHERMGNTSVKMTSSVPRNVARTVKYISYPFLLETGRMLTLASV